MGPMEGQMARIVFVIAAAAILALPSMAIGQVPAPLSPYPQCQANKAAKSLCACGVKPSATCPAGSWCSFTPEGAPQCTRGRPLHR